MGLFGEDDEETAEEVDPPALEDEPQLDASDQTDAAEGSGESPASDEGEASADEAPGEAPSEGAEDANEKGEGAGRGQEDQVGDDIDVEEALKDLSARMSVLSSNLEGVQENRDQLEDKIGDVEERMSRLGSLAEAVSSEYNPFVSENAPDQPSWNPEQEDPGAGEDPAPEPSPGPEADAPDPEDGPAPDGLGDPPGGPQAPQPEPGPAEPEPESSPVPQTDPASLQPDEEEPAAEPEQGTDPLGEPARSRERDVGDGEEPGELEENLILLEWVGMMLDRVGRAGLMDLLDYYQNLGWLDRETKDQVTRVAVGVDAPDRVGDGHWRGDVELHRRSLVAIQRLQGDEIPAARLDELELDLRRLFRE